MKKAAIISLTIPEIPGKSGGEIRDIYLFEHIARSYETDYFSIHNYFGEGEVDKDFAGLFKNMYYASLINEQYHDQIDESIRLSFFEKLRYKWSLSGVYLPGQKMPAEILGFRNEFNRYIKKFLERRAAEEKYDYVFISPQVNPAIVQDIILPENTKIIWATYDVEKIRHARLLETKKGLFKKMFYRMEMAAACRYEKDAVRKSDGIIAVSELDRESFIKFYQLDSNKVLSIENGVDVDYFHVMEDVRNHNIVFVGNMGYAPNDQATHYFVKEVFPDILKKIPDAHFYAVGANASEELKALETENITVTGRVEDVREYLKTACVVCVPLLAGSGTKYKVLEAMACGKAVVTTSYGSEGLDVTHNENIIVAKDSQEIVEYVTTLLEQDNTRQEMGNKARDFILNNHAWGVVLPKVNAWAEKL